MASKKNLPDIARKIREHIDKSDGVYRDQLVKQLVNTCSQDTYEFVSDFEWYLSMLLDLSMLRGERHVKRSFIACMLADRMELAGLNTGTLISDQLMDIAVRVEVIRPFAFERLVALMHNEHIMSESATDCAIQEVLYAASWVVGEFVNPQAGENFGLGAAD